MEATLGEEVKFAQLNLRPTSREEHYALALEQLLGRAPSEIPFDDIGAAAAEAIRRRSIRASDAEKALARATRRLEYSRKFTSDLLKAWLGGYLTSDLGQWFRGELIRAMAAVEGEIERSAIEHAAKRLGVLLDVQWDRLLVGFWDDEEPVELDRDLVMDALVDLDWRQLKEHRKALSAFDKGYPIAWDEDRKTEQ